MIGANCTIQTYRMAQMTGADAKLRQYGVSAVVDGADAYIESERAQTREMLGKSPGIETFAMQIDPCDIKVTDKVVTSNGLTAYVTDIEKHENNPDCDDLYTVSLTGETPLPA